MFRCPVRRVLAVFAVIALSAGALVSPASAQTRDENWTQCGSTDVDVRVRACTALIQSGRETASNLATAWGNRGLVYLKLNQADAAIADYDAALKSEPRVATSLYGRGVAKQIKGDTAGGNADIAAATEINSGIADKMAKYGVKPYTRATQASPPPASQETATSLYNQALEHVKSKHYPSAIDALQNAIRLEPGKAIAHYELGWIYDEQERYDLALDPLRLAVRYNPKDGQAFAELAWAYRKLERYDESIAAYVQSVALRPDSAGTYNDLAWAYNETEQYGLAVDAARAALLLRPDFADVSNELGYAYLQMKLYRDAITALQQAVRQEPDHPQARLNMGLAYFRMGNRDAAMEQYRELQRIDPTRAKTLFSEIGNP